MPYKDILNRRKRKAAEIFPHSRPFLLPVPGFLRKRPFMTEVPGEVFEQIIWENENVRRQELQFRSTLKKKL